MVYAKSTIGALFAALLCVLLLLSVELLTGASRVSGPVSFDTIRLTRSPIFWIVAILGYSGSFYLIFRKASR